MNNLILERGDTPGMYRAQMNIDFIWMTGVGFTWHEAIDDLLVKIQWRFPKTDYEVDRTRPLLNYEKEQLH